MGPTDRSSRIRDPNLEVHAVVIAGQPHAEVFLTQDLVIEEPLADQLLTAASRGQWVRMHMISQALGGKGKVANLIPAPHAINVGPQVLGSFEKRPKDLVAKVSGRTKKPNVIWIKTQVTRFHPPDASGGVSGSGSV